ncbi:spore germination protein [Heliorestis acidaminivorans]|uniref:spore germination protein n=1 Tax=Heliorestis acidaminivorans TaxID=553427 RepID=UPI00147891F0|nr:spore germination protein [Heliorestis acidaminivorans]
MSLLNWKKSLQNFKKLFVVDSSTQGKTFSLSSSRQPYQRKVTLTRKYNPKNKEKRDIPVATKDIQKAIASLFHANKNPDFVNRVLKTSYGQISIFYYQSMIDAQQVQDAVIEPLVSLNAEQEQLSWENLKDLLTYSHVTKEVTTLEDSAVQISAGRVFVHVEGFAIALAVKAGTRESRAVESPKTETVIRGANDSFVEEIRTNLYLLRMRLSIPEFIAEPIEQPHRSQERLYMLYIEGVTSPKLVKEMRRRLQAINVDALHSIGNLEHYVQGRPLSVFSQGITTERPDRTISHLLEGSVAVMMKGSPNALLMPVTLWSQLHSPEDYYFRWPIGTFARVIRLIALIVAIFLPSLYIAVVNFHPEMIRTELMLSIASARERVPFPTFLEILFLELAFEFIRESALRIPNMIGPTIGIVGAIIIGQAVVEAGIVSPIVIVILAITVLAGFSIPYYTLTYSVRILRLIFVFFASTFGFFGIVVGLLLLAHHLVSLKSLGVPFLSPVSPLRPGNQDVIIRPLPYLQELRPTFMGVLNKQKEALLQRPWDVNTPSEIHLLKSYTRSKKPALRKKKKQ